MNQGGIRDLEQLQEREGSDRASRLVSIVLVGLGGACVVFAAMALSGRHSAPTAVRADPLGDLVRNTKGAPPALTAKAPALTADDITFPETLSDNSSPTTALAAVRTSAPPAAVTAQPLAVPPLAGDRLPVVPLPAQQVLQATSVATRPRDPLAKAASQSAQNAGAGTSAPAGHDGGYQLQVSSFRTEAEAQEFEQQLRVRGHKAHVVEAHVPGRGTWYRVRVGPFASQQAAFAYRASFESKEHVVPFVVPPNK